MTAGPLGEYTGSMHRQIHALLTVFARKVVRRYSPHAVGITGSYGKTSAKEAIAAVLSYHYNVRRNAKSFNNDYGVPFTILGVGESGGGMRRVLAAIIQGFRLLWTRAAYPTVLVVEMGADRPGDIARLVEIIPVTVGVLTSIGPVHLRQFGTVDAVFAEKSLLATAIPPTGWAVLNGDDPKLCTLAESAPVRIISYGYQSGVAVRCLDAGFGTAPDGSSGMLLTVSVGTQSVPVFLRGVVGRHTAYAALAAVATGMAFSMDLVDIAAGLRLFEPPPGRMRLIAGIKQIMLIDDSYNSSPETCTAAIEALRELPVEGRRYAMLGDMDDLGTATEPAHRAVGITVIEEKIDVLITVGERMKYAADEARKAGMREGLVFSFDDARAAAHFVQERIRPNDAILIKGSQVMRMERAVEELMAEPDKAASLLVRQDPKWKSTP